jgi:E3 ubiquitin-protein ligase RNF14
LHPSKRLVILEIPVQLQHSHTLVLSPDSNCKSEYNSTFPQIEVTSLPPIILGLRLPSAYPSAQPPQVVSVISLHSWFPRHHNLQERLDALWQEGEGVLCTWIEFVESGQLLVDLGFVDSAHTLITFACFTFWLVITLTARHRVPNLSYEVGLQIQEWDQEQKMESFHRASYACTVCLTCVKGAHCIALSCTHVFCRECLEEYWHMLIDEGSVMRVGCPDPECLKKQHKALPEEIEKVVAEEDMERWTKLTEKAVVESGLDKSCFPQQPNELILNDRCYNDSLSETHVPAPSTWPSRTRR